LLFDPRPKTCKKDLYNFNDELNSLIKFFSKSLTIVTGLRRTGKTSLVLTALEESAMPYIYIDLREGVSSYRDLYIVISKSFERFASKFSKRDILWSYIVKGLKSIKGVSIAGFEISFSWGRDRVLLTELFEVLDNAAERANTKIVVVFDEVQKIRGSISEILYSSIAHSYDFHRNISFVLTGSEMGLLYNVVMNPKSPLYGRVFMEVKTRRLNVEESRDFLLTGFREVNMHVSFNEIDLVVDELGGIIGWLTYYGYLKINGVENLETIKKTAIEMAKTEIENFLRFRVSKRYRVVLKLLAKGYREWGLLKKELEKYEGREISDRVLHDILKTLKIYSIIDENNNFLDPIIKDAVAEL